MDDAYWIFVAKDQAKRSKCLRRDVGSVLVHKSEEAYVLGINGSDLCESAGCLRSRSLSGRDLQKCRGVHSEIRAILKLLRSNVNPEDFTLYVTHFPCSHCVPVIVECGIKEIVYADSYGDQELSLRILEEAGVKTRKYREEK